MVVGVSDMKLSNNADDVIMTYSLGSCIAVCVYDPVAHAGGMLHFQLPSSIMDDKRAEQRPFMYADTGMRSMMTGLGKLGAKKNRMKVKIAGGAKMERGPGGFDIGKRNYLAIRKMMWKNGMIIQAEEVGGASPRNMTLSIGDGAVTIRTGIMEKSL